MSAAMAHRSQRRLATHFHLWVARAMLSLTTEYKAETQRHNWAQWPMFPKCRVVERAFRSSAGPGAKRT